MSVSNRETLVIEYSHLCMSAPMLAYWLVEEPTEMLKIFDEVALKFAKSLMPLLYATRRGPAGGPSSDAQAAQDQRREVHVRISGLPDCEPLRGLRQQNLNRLVMVSGVVTRRTAVYPQLKVVHFECGSCQGLIGPIVINTDNNSRQANIPKPQMCPHCQASGNGGAGASTHFSINQSRTVYRNYQKLTLQESPGMVPPGRIPSSKEVILTNDLIDCARPGEEIVVTGVYKHSYDVSLNTRQGFPVFATIIEANYVTGGSKSSIGGNTSYLFQQLTEQDKEAIVQFSKQRLLLNRIVKSIAPSIFGHDDIKLGLALSLFGGVPKRIEGNHQTRGDINVLLVGDPGTAKSQFLKYVEKIAHRAVYTTGKGSTAVGLTAAVRKDPMTKEWTLEGGALVLADHGVCLIDEFDKMNDQDRTSIHEAMEQQTISISKAGIVTTLQARCSIIAAANPIKGRYESAKTFHENVDLTDPILSRFDVLCVVKDTVNPTLDEKLALFVVNSHVNSHPAARKRKRTQEQVEDNQRAVRNEQQAPDEDDALLRMNADAEGDEQQLLDQPHQLDASMVRQDDEAAMPQDFLKKYIVYAKEKVHPKLNQIDEDKISEFYKELRKESANSGGMTITVRHLESTIRMAEACARLHLRDYVNDFDVNTAIGVMLESFVQTQKHSISRSLRNKFKRYLRTEQQDYTLLLHLLQNVCLKEAQFQHAQARFRRQQQKQQRRASAGDDIDESFDEEDEDEEGEQDHANVIKIEYQDFANTARQYEIYGGLKSFLRSEMATSRGFTFQDVDSYIFYTASYAAPASVVRGSSGAARQMPPAPYEMAFSQDTQ